MSSDALADALRTVPDFPKPGIQFKDITPILGDPRLLQEAARRLADPYRDAGVTHVAGMEARGFLLGALVAAELGAGFLPVRKPGKLPAATFSEAYALEYGTDTLELHRDACGPDDVVLIHDDVIATGGTAAAAHRLVARTGARVAGFSFLIELAFLDGCRALPADVRVERVLRL